MSLATNSDWVGFLAESDTAELIGEVAKDEDGGREISHEFEQEMTRDRDMEVPCEEAMEDDPIDPAQAGYLDAVRKALALDEVDQDVIPER